LAAYVTMPRRNRPQVTGEEVSWMTSPETALLYQMVAS
jgi:hypothetical protein